MDEWVGLWMNESIAIMMMAMMMIRMLTMMTIMTTATIKTKEMAMTSILIYIFYAWAGLPAEVCSSSPFFESFLPSETLEHRKHLNKSKK